VISVDGKTARGARRPDGTQTHLFAAFDQASGVVLGQTAVDAACGETSELGRFRPAARQSLDRRCGDCGVIGNDTHRPGTPGAGRRPQLGISPN
jgi:hypothetical protein